ncbi:hypothetical protein NF868_08065 [Bacillus zhangzhouensis]|nr:hypothetical protein NF868_08065 [Bacillus zhangzhouensis]
MIGVKDEVKGEALVCFIAASSQSFEEETLIQELKTHVGSYAEKALTPKEIHLISALPKTRNGKIVRRLLKGAYEQQPSPDLSSLDNPKVYKSICEYLKKKQNL